MSSMKKIRFAVEYAFVRLLALAFSSMTWELCSSSGAFLGALASFLFPGRFRLTVDNIRRAFPEKSAGEAEKIARRSWENMGRTAGEFAKSLTLTRDELLKRCSVENSEKALSYTKSGKGVIVHLGHIANWEVTGITFGAAGLEMCAIARRIKNPYVNSWITALRQRYGGVVIPHKNPFFSSVRALKQGKFLGILMDQNMPNGDVFLPFFGRPAATTPITALLSLKTGAPIFPLRVSRVGGRITAVFEDPIIPSGECTPENTLALIGRLNEKLEEWIRSDPAMWLWAHNRWKRSAEASRAAGKSNTV